MWVPETVAAAFSMFSAIPMPQFPWSRQNLRYVLCAFPLVGAVIGICCYLWSCTALGLSLPPILRGAGLCLLPVVLTGGIHLDGYADTSDALASHAPPERRRKILHDSHCGAFAVIRLCTYFTGMLALCTALRPDRQTAGLLIPAFVLSRALSGTALTVLPIAPDSSLVRTFATAADRRRVRVILTAEALAAALGLCVTGGPAGGAMVLAALAVLFRYAVAARRDFGGTSGDLAGWFLQKAEFWMLAVLVLVQSVEAV